MLRPRFTDPARTELAHAIVWYRTEAGPERATDFRNAIKRVLIRACRFPLSARVIDQADGLDLDGKVQSRVDASIHKCENEEPALSLTL